MALEPRFPPSHPGILITFVAFLQASVFQESLILPDLEVMAS